MSTRAITWLVHRLPPERAQWGEAILAEGARLRGLARLRWFGHASVVIVAWSLLSFETAMHAFLAWMMLTTPYYQVASWLGLLEVILALGRARGGKRVPATWVVTILAIAVLRTFFLHDRLLPHPWSWIGYGVVGLVVLRAIDLHNKQIERSE